jgi:hypothetical protein
LKSRQTKVPSPNWPHVRRGPPAGTWTKLSPARKFDWIPALGPLRLDASTKQNLKSRQTNVPSPNWPHVRRGPPAGTTTRNAPERKFSLDSPYDASRQDARTQGNLKSHQNRVAPGPARTGRGWAGARVGHRLPILCALPRARTGPYPSPIDPLSVRGERGPCLDSWPARPALQNPVHPSRSHDPLLSRPSNKPESLKQPFFLIEDACFLTGFQGFFEFLARST